MRSLISYAMYPKVYEDYLKHRKDYGYIMRMGSHVFFNGMALGETNKISIEEGKTLVIKYLGLGDSYEDGTREVRFELNGSRREIRVPDPHTTSMAVQVQMADSTDKSQIGSSIPGMVSKVMVKAGDTVKENQVVAVVEAMKMETSVVAGMDGVVKEVLVTPGKTVKAGELLIRIG
jgi:pyruvate carboxylase